MVGEPVVEDWDKRLPLGVPLVYRRPPSSHTFSLPFLLSLNLYLSLSSTRNGYASPSPVPIHGETPLLLLFLSRSVNRRQTTQSSQGSETSPQLHRRHGCPLGILLRFLRFLHCFNQYLLRPSHRIQSLRFRSKRHDRARSPLRLRSPRSCQTICSQTLLRPQRRRLAPSP